MGMLHNQSYKIYRIRRHWMEKTIQHLHISSIICHLNIRNKREQKRGNLNRLF